MRAGVVEEEKGKKIFGCEGKGGLVGLELTELVPPQRPLSITLTTTALIKTNYIYNFVQRILWDFSLVLLLAPMSQFS